MSEQEYNGYPNRETWLFPLHFPDFLENKADEIWQACSRSWELDIDDELTVVAFMQELRYMVPERIYEIVEREISDCEYIAQEAVDSTQNLFIADMINVDRPFAMIDTDFLVKMYTADYIEGVKSGAYRCDVYDIAVANDKNRAA